MNPEQTRSGYQTNELMWKRQIFARLKQNLEKLYFYKPCGYTIGVDMLKFICMFKFILYEY